VLVEIEIILLDHICFLNDLYHEKEEEEEEDFGRNNLQH
jgi:hypothetical protein